MKNKFIEVFIINYNGKNTVLSTIESLYKSCDVEISLSVMDDHSIDDSLELVKKNFPEVIIKAFPFNTKKPNILRNKALHVAKSEYVFITDNDLKFDSECLSKLLKVMESNSQIGACSPRLMYWDQPDRIYAAGTQVHFIGAAVSDLRDKVYNENIVDPILNSGGGICLLRRSAALKIGGFDEELMWGWGEDGEFYQRLLRAGYKSFCIPSAFALHENKLDTTRKLRVIGQTYNRWVFILSHYSLPLILLSLPAFILYEIFQFGFVLMKGVLSQYFKGNLLVLKNIPAILKKRKFIQRLKMVSDKEVLFAGNIYVAPALLEKNKLLKLALNTFSSIFNLYWSLVKKIIP